MPTVFARDRGPASLLAPHGAIVWLDRGRAIVTTQEPAGTVHVREFSFAEPVGEGPGRYAALVHALVEADPVVVLGNADARVDLERAFVSIVKAPERLHEPVQDPQHA